MGAAQSSPSSEPVSRDEAEEKGRSMLEISGEHRLRAENLPFDIDVWYPLLKEHTFETSFHPITKRAALAVVRYYWSRFIRSNTPCFTPHDAEILDALEKALDIEIATRFPDGAFLRLCGRSPKDAEPLDRGPLRESYQKELALICGDGDLRSATPEQKMNAIGRVNWMHCRTGREVMSLLLTSERVYADLIDVLQYGEPEQIVLRKWERDLSLEFEFRAFVFQGRLNAISQYDPYFPPSEILLSLKSRIEELIVAKWGEVHALIGEVSYCIDFGYLPRTDTLTVIEISPFLPCTGSALFKWTTDSEILRNEKPTEKIEFRLATSSHPFLSDLISVNWEDRWRGDLRPYFEFYPELIRKCSAPPADLPFLRNLTKNDENLKYKIFFYGTLKTGFQWNTKYLHSSRFITAATTMRPFSLVIGACGVPYMFADEGEGGNVGCFLVRGEVWEVGEATLQGLDEYEGLDKDYYTRESIQVQCVAGDIFPVFVYMKSKVSEGVRGLPKISEYTLEEHKERYKPIRHIQIKQQIYMDTVLTSLDD